MAEKTNSSRWKGGAWGWGGGGGGTGCVVWTHDSTTADVVRKKQGSLRDRETEREETNLQLRRRQNREMSESVTFVTFPISHPFINAMRLLSLQRFYPTIRSAGVHIDLLLSGVLTYR